ncbi:MAG: class I SAM-dependent DNA methyltransferase [Bacillota bacterium]
MDKPGPENLFDNFGGDYDRMIDWDTRLKREEPFFAGLFTRYNTRSVLDAACGTGHHALLFAARGHAVAGADLSPTMVEQARANAAAKGLPVEFVQAGFGQLAKTLGREFDAVVCLGNSLPHIKSTGDIQSVLVDFYRVLNRGGVLVIQNRNYNKALAEKSRFMPLNHCRSGTEETLYLRFTDFPEKDPAGLITFNIVVLQKDVTGKWSYRVHSEQLKPWLKEEMALLLNAARFKNIHYYGDYGGKEYEPESSTDLIIVAEKQ